AKRNSKQGIDPLIEESEVLRKLVRDPRSRDSGNTVLSKDFPGGVLVMTGANSAVGLRSMAARYLFLDEVDAYRRGFARLLDLPFGRQEVTINIGSAAALYKKLATTTEGYVAEVPIIHQAVAVKAAI